MIDLKAFIQAVQDAVVEAAHTVREHNLQLAYKAFDIIPPSPPEQADGEDEPAGDPPRDGRPRGLAVHGQDRAAGRGAKGGKGGKGGKGRGAGDGSGAEGPPLLTPKLVAFQFPIDTPDGPDVHTAYVPVASLMGTQNFEITEFKLNLKVSLTETRDKSGDGEKKVMLSLGGPARPRRGAAKGEEAAAEPELELGTIEVVIKSTEPPGGYYELIRGYDRGLRADIPG